MRTRGPVLTLLAVLAVGVAAFAVNTVVVGGGGQQPVPAAAAQQAPAQQPGAQQAAGDGYGAGDYAAGAAAAAPVPAPQDAAPQAVPQDAAPQAVPKDAAPQAVPQAAAPAQAQAATGTFAGRSAGNEVTVAMGVDGDRVVAYVCDGHRVEAWLEGTMTGSSLQLTGADGELSADASSTAVLGTVAVGGKSWPFSAQPEKSGGAATDRAALKRLGSA